MSKCGNNNTDYRSKTGKERYEQHITLSSTLSSTSVSTELRSSWSRSAHSSSLRLTAQSKSETRPKYRIIQNFKSIQTLHSLLKLEQQPNILFSSKYNGISQITGIEVPRSDRLFIKSSSKNSTLGIQITTSKCLNISTTNNIATKQPVSMKIVN